MPISGAQDSVPTLTTFNEIVNNQVLLVVQQGSCVDTSQCLALSIGLQEEVGGEVPRLVPHPADEWTTLVLPEVLSRSHSPASLKIYNAYGEPVLEREFRSSNVELSTRNWPAGTYWVQLTVGTYQWSTVMVVVH